MMKQKAQTEKREVLALLCVVLLWPVNLKTNCVPRAAAGALRQVVKVAPNSIYAHALFGIACNNCGQHDESSEAYCRAEEIEEIEIAKKAVRSAPNDPNAHFDLGRAYYDASDFSKGHQRLPGSYPSGPKAPQSIHGPRQCMRRVRDGIEASVKAYKEAATLDPNDSWVHVCMAFTYNDMRMYEASIAEWKRLIELEPDDAQLRGLLADVYLKTGQY